jgi:hypothetical protein
MKFNTHIKKLNRAGAAAVLKEQYRELKEYKNEVNSDLSSQNICDCDRQKVMDDIQKAIEITEQNGKKIKKDRICLCSAVMSVPSSWDDKSEEKYYEFQKEKLKELLQKQGCNVDVNVVIHRDEGHYEHGEFIRHRHATMTFVPLVNDEKLDCKHVLTKPFLFQYQHEMYENYLKFADEYSWLEEMEPPKNEGRKHLSELEYKDHQNKLKREKLLKMEASAEKEKGRLKALKEPETGGLFRKDYVTKKDYEKLYKTAEKLAESLGIQKQKIEDLTYEKQKSREQYTDKIQDLRHEKELLKSEMSEMKATDLGKTIAENRQLKAENERLRDDLASARQQVRQYENVLEMAQISHSRGRER